MSKSHPTSLGRSAVLAGLLWTAAVGGEIVLKPQRPDGSVESPVLFALLVAASVVGSLFLAQFFRRLSAIVTAGDAAPRAVRVGAWCAVIGAALLFVFSLLAFASGLATGTVWEPSFLAFALGMLFLLLGQVTLGLGVRRMPLGSGGVWAFLVLAGACVLVAIVVAVDPWHDLALFGLFGFWIAAGARLSRVTAVPVLVDQPA